MPAATKRAVADAIWRVGRSFVGGDINDNEWQRIFSIAMSIKKKTYTKYHSLSAGELAAAACQHYFSR